MPSRVPTTIQQRQQMMEMDRAGYSIQAISTEVGVSESTARKWTIRSREKGLSGLVSTMGRPATGYLSTFPPMVRYLALRLKRQHAGWGAGYIVHEMAKHPGLQGVDLPDPSVVWRYWRSFGDRLFQRRRPIIPRPLTTTEVHGIWQLDFKESVEIAGIGRATVSHARDSVGRATVLHRVHLAQESGQQIVKLTTSQVQNDCRVAFTQWGLPDRIQTDHASIFAGDDPSPFPTKLVLWWRGLSIAHQMIRRGPQENGSVERSHRTMVERTLSGRIFPEVSAFQSQLDADWQELNTVLPSRARGCDQLPPTVAHPALLWPRRTYTPETEAELFDLASVDAYLATFTWTRKTSARGVVSLGNQPYGLGIAWASRPVSIQFLPNGRLFSFTDLLASSSSRPAITKPAIGLLTQDIIGPIAFPADQPTRQLCFSFLSLFPQPQELSS